MKHTSEIHNGMEVIDSRDVIARIAALEEMRDDAQEAKDGEPETMEDGTEIYTSADFMESEYSELKLLQGLAEEASDSPDWTHGVALISESYFEDYARELAEDLGLMENCDKWPATCID